MRADCLFVALSLTCSGHPGQLASVGRHTAASNMAIEANILISEKSSIASRNIYRIVMGWNLFLFLLQ